MPIDPLLCTQLALAGAPLAPAGPGGPDAACLYADIDAAGQLGVSRPEVGVSQAFTVPRARFGLGISDGGVAAGRVVVSTVRSGGESGAIGVDGESLVGRVEVAEARLTAARFGAHLVAGLIDDFWVTSGDPLWGLRSVAPTLGEDRGWMARSDLGGGAAWTAPRALATAGVTLVSGEGAQYRERNNGKDTAGMLTLRPLALAGAEYTDWLVVSGLYRDGSRGIDRSRDHRAAVRVSTQAGPVSAGVEAVKAWGVDGDPQYAPAGASGWVVGGYGPALAYLRYDGVQEIPGEPDSRASALRAGAGYAAGDALTLLAGVERQTAGAQATPVAGAEGEEQLMTYLVQLRVRLQGAAPIALIPNNAGLAPQEADR